jgi:hypothetical protein
MKKNILILSFVFFITEIFSQTIPNADFENWTNMGNYSDPDSWGTLNSSTDFANVYTTTQGTPGYSGASYLKVTSQQVSSQVVPGIAATGIINPQDYSISGGFPFTGRPAFLNGSWQYMVANLNDQGSINIFLTKWNTSTNSRDTISATLYSPHGMVMAWENFSIPLTYFLTGNPDTCLISIWSSNLTTTTVNSYLWIDDLSFSGVAGTNEISSSSTNLSVYPNPAENFVNVSVHGFDNTNLLTIKVFNVTGQLVYSTTNAENNFQIDTEQWNKGLYTIVISQNDNVSRRKFIVE